LAKLWIDATLGMVKLEFGKEQLNGRWQVAGGRSDDSMLKQMFRSPMTVALIGASCLMFLLGCGGDGGPTYATVKGTVKLDGEVIKLGTVIFLPTGDTKGPASAGEIMEDGTYEILGPAGKGVVVGTHKVMLLCPEEGSGPDTGEDPNADVGPCMIPDKYTQENSTDISETVSEGENTIDINLVK
jgi:hypothetical protein